MAEWDANTFVAASRFGLLRHQTGKTFVLTGTMSTKRDQIIMLIEAAGGKVAARISATVDMLVIPTGSVASYTKKMDDAYRYGVKVIDENELGDLLLPTSDELERGVWATPHIL